MIFIDFQGFSRILSLSLNLNLNLDRNLNLSQFWDNLVVPLSNQIDFQRISVSHARTLSIGGNKTLKKLGYHSVNGANGCRVVKVGSRICDKKHGYAPVGVKKRENARI